VSPVKYELEFYIPEGDILHSHRRESLKSDVYQVPNYIKVCCQLHAPTALFPG
jgi:hypothetical protein